MLAVAAVLRAIFKGYIVTKERGKGAKIYK
jgi:hypothetical protein